MTALTLAGEPAADLSISLKPPSPLRTPEPVKVPHDGTAGLGIPELILRKFLAGQEHAAELTARLASESGYSLTDIYEMLRMGIYCTDAELTDVEVLRIAELDQRLCRLANRLPLAPSKRREPEAIVLSTHRLGIPAALCHMLSDIDIPPLSLDLPHFARHRRGGAGIPHQFGAVRYVFIDAAHAGPQDLQRLFATIQQLRLLSGEFTVILLADNKAAVELIRRHDTARFVSVWTLPGAMIAAGLSANNPLTVREQDVLCYISKGATNQQAARALGISIATVKTYLERAQGKLHSVDRASAVAVALRRGWL